MVSASSIGSAVPLASRHDSGIGISALGLAGRHRSSGAICQPARRQSNESTVSSVAMINIASKGRGDGGDDCFGVIGRNVVVEVFAMLVIIASEVFSSVIGTEQAANLGLLQLPIADGFIKRC